MVDWGRVTHADVVRALKAYDRLGPEAFFAEHGFAPTTTYELAWEERRYPPKAILGAAYEFATGKRLASGDFEGGKSGAVKVLGQLGFTVQGSDGRPNNADISARLSWSGLDALIDFGHASEPCRGPRTAGDFASFGRHTAGNGGIPATGNSPAPRRGATAPGRAGKRHTIV